ncbi:unnamed protein product [Amoebophrya sp. A120]|nr:unnamed protein product [Amoebophrya sp. A120]|eukprot:GSA120T00004680001.1
MPLSTALQDLVVSNADGRKWVKDKLAPVTPLDEDIGRYVDNVQAITSNDDNGLVDDLDDAADFTTNLLSNILNPFGIFGKSTKTGHYKYFRVFKIPSNGYPQCLRLSFPYAFAERSAVSA